MRLTSLLGVAAWVLASSCGGDGESDTGNNPGGQAVSVEEFPARYASGWCGLLERCCLASNGTGQGACESDLQPEMVDRQNEAAASGATWDAAAAGRCLAAIDDADCAGMNAEALRAILDDCSDTWDGVIPPGGPCENYEACAEPPVTGGATSGASCVNSVCVQVVRLPPGAACSESDTTQACDPFLATCVSDVCEPLPEAGQPCSDSCRAGSRCVDGMCTALLGLGETCVEEGDCASDQCSGGQCVSGLIEGQYCLLP